MAVTLRSILRESAGKPRKLLEARKTIASHHAKTTNRAMNSCFHYILVRVGLALLTFVWITGCATQTGNYKPKVDLPISQQKLSEADIRRINQDIRAIGVSFDRADINGILDKTHESFFRVLGGGREQFTSEMQNVLMKFQEEGFKRVHSEIKAPSRVYPAGPDQVGVFVPVVNTYTMRGHTMRVKSTGFMIAIRSKGKSGWKYLDGAVVRKKPGMLKQMLPELDPRIPFPPTKTEKIYQ